MDVFSVAALVTGLLGALFGGVSLWYARQSARASELSARAAQDSVAFQMAASTARNAANLVFVPLQNSHVLHDYRAETDKLTISVSLFNRGPADAHELSMAVSHGEHTASSQMVVLLRSLEKRRFDLTLPLIDPIPNTDYELRLSVKSTDRNGTHSGFATIVVSCLTSSSLALRLAASAAPGDIPVAVE